MKDVQKLSLHNRFDIEVRDVRTGELRQKAFAENIILNQAWEQILGTGRDWFNAIAFGTGTGTPVIGNTNLFTPLSIKTASDSVYVSDIANNYISHRQKIILLETEYNGQQISELGIASSNSNTLCTHAMIKDMNGNPVVINKTDVDIVTIYATVYLHPNVSYGTGAALLDFYRYDPGTAGWLATLLGRRYPYGSDGSSYKGDWKFKLGVTSADEFVTPLIYDYVSQAGYPVLTPATKSVVFSVRIPADSANVGGLRSYAIMGAYSDTAGYYGKHGIIGRLRSASLTQATVVEQIGTGDGNATDFATSFGFIPSNTVVKIDGTPVSPAIISGAPSKKSMRGFMRPVSSDLMYMQWGADDYIAEDRERIFENPFYTTYGLNEIYGSRFILSSSDDMVSWSEAALHESGTTTPAVVTIAAGSVNKRYWKIENSQAYGYRIWDIYCTALDNFKNIRFSTPPAAGEVITAEYTPDCAAKDENHVLDIEVTLQLGEYTP